MTNHSMTTVEPHVEKLQTAAVELGRNLGDFYRESVEAALNDNGAFGHHQEQNLEDDTVAGIVEKIERSGVKYLYYMLPTLGARTVAKMVPAKHIVRNLEKGIAFHRTALSDLQAKEPAPKAEPLVDGSLSLASLDAALDSLAGTSAEPSEPATQSQPKEQPQAAPQASAESAPAAEAPKTSSPKRRRRITTGPIAGE